MVGGNKSFGLKTIVFVLVFSNIAGFGKYRLVIKSYRFILSNKQNPISKFY